mgnify:CR=1 FL=1
MGGKTILAALLTVVLAGAAQAQSPRSAWDGVYTDAQAQRGAALYARHCVMCHRPGLGGDYETPPLTGVFLHAWAGADLATLFDKVAVTMPLSRPGTLSPAENADILALILQANGFPAGTAELSADPGPLKAIRLDVARPARGAR